MCSPICFKFINQIHLFIDLHQEVFNVTIDVEHIPRNFGLDILRSVGITQCVLGLVEMLAGGANTDNHHCFAVAAKRELQQTGELRVSVGNVVPLPWIAESVDTASQGQERLVDVRTLHQPFTPILRGAGALAACQVDNTESGHRMRFVDVSVAIFLGDIDLENGVGS